MIGIKRGHIVWLKRDPDGGGGIWTERRSAGVGVILDGEVTIPNMVERALEEKSWMESLLKKDKIGTKRQQQWNTTGRQHIKMKERRKEEELGKIS